MPSATLSATPTSNPNWRAPGNAENAFVGTGRFFAAAAMDARRQARSDGHVHDFLVGVDEAVAHFRHRLERDVGLLERDHHLAEIRAGRAGLEALRELVRILLNAVHLIDGGLQERAEVGAARGLRVL